MVEKYLEQKNQIRLPMVARPRRCNGGGVGFMKI